MLSFAEFVYNSSVNRITSLSPFEIFTGYKCRAPIDLILMLATHKPSEFAFVFAQHKHSLHEKIYRKIMLINEYYKWSIDSHRVHRESQEGDRVMV